MMNCYCSLMQYCDTVVLLPASVQRLCQVSRSSHLQHCAALLATRNADNQLPGRAFLRQEAFPCCWKRKQDVYPGRRGFYSAEPGCGGPGGDVSRLLGEREALAGPEGVHPPEQERVRARAAGPTARSVHGVGQQRLPRLQVRGEQNLFPPLPCYIVLF